MTVDDGYRLKNISEDEFWDAVSRNAQKIRVRWEVISGALDPDGDFLAILERQNKDGEWDELDTEELLFHGDVDSFQEEYDWDKTVEKLIERNGVSSGDLSEIIDL